MMEEAPLSLLSASQQNARPSPAQSITPFAPSPDSGLENSIPYQKLHRSNTSATMNSETDENTTKTALVDEKITTNFSVNTPRLPLNPSQRTHSPQKLRSLVKYRLQENAMATSSPPGSPAQSTVPIHSLTMPEADPLPHTISQHYTSNDESVLDQNVSLDSEAQYDAIERPQIEVARTEDTTLDLDITLGADETSNTLDVDNTTHLGDLSTISAIPTDLTRFAALHNSPTKTLPPSSFPADFTPRHAARNSIATTPMTGQRPLHLLSRRSTSNSSNEDEEATPRRNRRSADSPVDLMNFTGQTNILIPPPSTTSTRSARRSPSGRGAFPIRINPSTNGIHKSQASLDRERASGRSPQKFFPDLGAPGTPANHRHSVHTTNGLGMDLLDIDLGPMATPRSIPTVTPRELESLRSELQSRISGLEATLSGKEAEVGALKKSVTDAEIRAGNTSEELRNVSAEKDDISARYSEVEKRAREMEEVLREVKQNAFVEEREREKLRKQAEEADHRSEELEVKILELTASLETLRQGRISPSLDRGPSTPGAAVDVDAAVKNATETVARELHALYKNKHERKVGDLKLSYEKRWIKQVDNLKQELKESKEHISRLQTSLDSNQSGPSSATAGQAEALSKASGQIEELRRWNEDLSSQKKVMEAELSGSRAEYDNLHREAEGLRRDLEQERAEKGDLVAQVEVFLNVSAEQEVERQREQEERELRERERQPVSPPRSDTSGDFGLNGFSGGGTHGNAAAVAALNGQSANGVGIVASPNKLRSVNGAVGISGRPRPMSMLAKPTAGKFASGLPGPGGSKAPAVTRGSVYGKGGLMDGIARMGAGSR